MIAMALALEPALLIADEPTTALDVTTQAQILKLILELQKKHGMGVLFITHDFGVVAEIAHRVAVLREGRLVELGAKHDVLQRPQHEYTRMLIRAVPTLEPHSRAATRRRHVVLTDEEPVQDLRRAAAGSAAGAKCARPTTSISRCARARRSASSANRARASRRWRAASCG